LTQILSNHIKIGFNQLMVIIACTWYITIFKHSKQCIIEQTISWICYICIRLGMQAFKLFINF